MASGGSSSKGALKIHTFNDGGFLVRPIIG